MLAAESENRMPSNAFWAGGGRGSRNSPLFRDEYVRGIALGEKPAGVEHQRVVCSGCGGLDLRQNRIEQVVVMDLGVEYV